MLAVEGVPLHTGIFDSRLLLGLQGNSIASNFDADDPRCFNLVKCCKD